MHTVSTGMIPNFRVIQVFCYALVANRNNERARYVLSGIFADEPLMFFSIFSNQSTSSLEDRYFTSVLLEPRSLFLLTGDLYHNYLHGIAERTNDVRRHFLSAWQIWSLVIAGSVILCNEDLTHR